MAGRAITVTDATQDLIDAAANIGAQMDEFGADGDTQTEVEIYLEEMVRTLCMIIVELAEVIDDDD